MTGVPAPTRPPAWTLRRGHPDLCPGSGDPCLYDPCYRHTRCPRCGAGVGADHAPSVPGGGRVSDHYPAGPVPDEQLDLFTEEAHRG